MQAQAINLQVPVSFSVPGSCRQASKKRLTLGGCGEKITSCFAAYQTIRG
jgi:hypothetical protein